LPHVVQVAMEKLRLAKPVETAVVSTNWSDLDRNSLVYSEW